MSAKKDGWATNEGLGSVSEASVTQWIEGLAKGDPLAQEKVWQRYYPRLLRVARNRLAGTERRVSDEDDLAQSAFASFFLGMKAGRFPGLRDRDGLWRLLLVMTAQKAASAVRHTRAAKRGQEKVRGESAFLAADGSDADAGINGVLGAEPTPEFAVMTCEQCERLLTALDDESLRRVATLRLEGYKVEEIAHQLTLAPGTIHRKLARIRRRWLELLDE